MPNQTYDAIIIGAGMSGFGAGIRLAMFDKKVCILEQHSVWGGLNSFYQQAGRQFDVGLHALTNYSAKGSKRGPFPTILRQLRLKWEDFDLHEQNQSVIKFPNHRLHFSNNLEVLISSVKEQFPEHLDQFLDLCSLVRDHDDGTLPAEFVSARQRLLAIIASPLLIDMIFCPLMFYGSATEHDMDWNQFVIMFKAVFFEGFSRPHAGVRKILSLLRKTYVDRGGEIRTKTSVIAIVPQASGGAKVILENGEEIFAAKVISCAGLPETKSLLGLPFEASEIGAMSFVETIFCLDKMPKELDISSTITFFSHNTNFKYQRSQDLVDYSSGILCSPNNFNDPTPLNEGMLRLTHIANPKLWKKLRSQSLEKYNEQKQAMVALELEGLKSIVPEFSKNIKYVDTFTPATIERFTRRIDGAVYGTPQKIGSGEIGAKDVYICGTDQGYLGIIGSLLSGILMANRHTLV